MTQKPSWAKETIRAGNEFHIRHQPILQHNCINILAVSMLWLTIAIIIVSSTSVHWGFYPILGVVLGAAFFGHFVLIIHEASHNMLFLHRDPNKRKIYNHGVGKLASLPFFTEYDRHWKDGHVVHHLQPCESNDPQNPDPLYGRRLIHKIIQVWCIPLGFMLVNPSTKYENKTRRIVLGVLCIMPVVYWMYQTNPQSLFVLYIGFNTLGTLNLCKIAQEHGAGLANEPFPILRSRTYFYKLQWLFSPFNIHYHYEHHANFNVPWYLLPNYHKTVKTIIPSELRSHFIHNEYWAQLMGTKKLPEWS